MSGTSGAPRPGGEPFGAKLARIRSAWQESKILMAGIELGLYDRLSNSPAMARELATDLGVTQRGIEILADALVALGYLVKQEGQYRNTPDVDRMLVRGRPEHLAYALAHGNHTFGNWAKLEEIIRHGQQRREGASPVLTDKTANRNFILAMAAASRDRIGPVLDRLPLATSRRFADVGGGPGEFACEAARRHPSLEVVLIDLPLTVEVAREQIESKGLSGRVQTRVCDFYNTREIDLGGPADLVLLSQVLHAEGPDENRALLRKIAPQVSPGGVIAISENLVDEERTGPLAGALFAVNMLASTTNGRTYTAGEISSWLDEAGFTAEPAVEAAERSWVILSRKRACCC